MAIISQDISKYIAALKSDPASWTLLKSEAPTKQRLRAYLQGLENWFEDNRAAAKAAMEAEAGAPITNAFAKKIARVWMQIKFGGE